MKILFLAGAESIHTVRWVNALSERGHEVVLISKKDHKAYPNTVSKAVKIVYLPFGGLKGYYLNAVYLRKIFQKDTFDIVNVHYASGYGTLARIAKLPNVILNVWGSDVYDFPYENKLKEKILRKNLDYAVQIASTSYSMAKQTEKFLKKKRDIIITPFGVDIQKFKPNNKKNSSNKFVFGIVKTLMPKYGIDIVIEAFSKFLVKLEGVNDQEIKLNIYGTGELLEDLRILVKKKGIEKQVYFGGYIPNNEVPHVLKQMDVFLLGSTLESFGVAAVEAMACGLPVIATQVSGFKEVIEDKKTGFLVAVNDSEAMADHMLKLYFDEKLRKRLGKAGRLRVEKLYDWNMNVDTMLKIYKRVMNHKKEHQT